MRYVLFILMLISCTEQHANYHEHFSNYPVKITGVFNRGGRYNHFEVYGVTTYKGNEYVVSINTDNIRNQNQLKLLKLDVVYVDIDFYKFIDNHDIDNLYDDTITIEIPAVNIDKYVY